MCVTIYKQYRRVTDRQTDRRTSCHGVVRAMHTRRVVKIAKIQTSISHRTKRFVTGVLKCQEALKGHRAS